MRTICVEFDNESDGEAVELAAGDVSLLLDNGQRLVPVRMESPKAFYELPDGVSDDEFEEALDDASWCFRSMAEVEPEDAPAP